MTTLKQKTSEPRLYSFIISPQQVSFKHENTQINLDARVIPQSICNVIAYDLDGAAKYITNIINGKGLSAKHTNDEPLGEFLKLSEQFIESPISAPTMITSPPPVEVPTKASAENWIAYLRDEAKKVGYSLRKIKIQ